MRINPKQLERAMKQMGMQTKQIEAEEVIIRTAEKDIVISNPNVTLMNAMGQESYQIVGDAEERPRSRFVNEDVKMVMEKTGATEEKARKALEDAGDIATAILSLKN
ncbi:MAG: nascent polypeptide-associated complex protein [Candidatus Aenigmarchaeota archaeon]|nr:nascent polypeptide-associated complex protein [Candidatus Aenigmarchaeota archaeon]